MASSRRPKQSAPVEELALPDAHWVSTRPGTGRRDRPSQARMYDYLLGGKDNFAIDREAADQVIALLGEAPARQTALENRAFLVRVVRRLAEQGMDQFIDLGAGLPALETVHEVVQAVNPQARVVYVDNDPSVVAHGRALLADDRTVQVFTGDLRRPDEILKNPVTARMIDFTRPVAVLMFAVLQSVPDAEDPAGIVDGYRRALAPGSAIAVSHATADGFDPVLVSRLIGVFRQTSGPLALRSAGQLAAILHDLDLVEPGLVRCWQWHPDPEADPGADAAPGSGWNYGAVGFTR